MALNSRQMKGVCLMAQGDLSNIAVAKECGVSENTVYNWLNNDEYLQELQKKQRKMFTRMACKAQKKMNELLDSNNPSIQFAAAKEILNKAGLDAPIKLEAEVESKVIFEGESEIED